MANRSNTVKMITAITAGVVALSGGGGVGGYYATKEMAEMATEADIFRRDISILNERIVNVEQTVDSIQDVALRMDTKLDILVEGYSGD